VAAPLPVLDRNDSAFAPVKQGLASRCIDADSSSRRGKYVKNSYLIATCLALALPSLSMSMDAEAAGKGQRGPRGELVHKIVMKWGNHVQEAYRTNVGEWASEMVPVFAKANLDTLRRAADAPSFDLMNEAFVANTENSSRAQNAILMADSGQIPGKTLGQIDNDLVFVPITPCRIADTRIAGGQIAANATRNFDVTAVTDYSFQGGAASNCGGAGAAGSFAAAALNFTVVTPGGAGYITAFPFLGTQPVAATVNYAAGDIVGNYAVVKLDQGASANELSVYSFAQTHLVIDIVGYYTNPQITPLDCVDTTAVAVTVAAGATANAVSSACPGTYSQTSTNCESSTWQMPFVYFKGGVCSAQNNSGATATLRASRTCCRIPGR